MRRSLPNVLSVSRIVLGMAILVVYGLAGVSSYVASIGMIGLALVTDYFDGRLARRWNVASELGLVLDTMGDRALHLSLLLAILVRYNLPPILVWLVIFRDIAIYAVRVLSPHWYHTSRKHRWISVTNASVLRCWMALFLARDGVRVFSGHDSFAGVAFDVAQSLVLGGALVLGYCGLIINVNELMKADNQRG